MKRNVFYMICCVICLLCLSCQDEEDRGIGNSPSPSQVGTLFDGGTISGIKLCCLKYMENGCSEDFHFEKYPTIKTVSNYSSFTVGLVLDCKAPNYVASSENEEYAIKTKVREYMKEKSSFMADRYHAIFEETHKEPGWAYFYTAYVNGDVTITCDKTLFGKKPGTDLSPYFAADAIDRTNSASRDFDFCVPKGVEAPKILYDFNTEKPREVSKCFAKNVWLQGVYYLDFVQQPSEKYEELTLHVTLPMLKENVRNIVVSEYKGVEREVFTESVYQAECKIKFNW